MRFPGELEAWVADVAAADGRSFSNMVVRLVEEARGVREAGVPVPGSRVGTEVPVGRRARSGGREVPSVQAVPGEDPPPVTRPKIVPSDRQAKARAAIGCEHPKGEREMTSFGRAKCRKCGTVLP